MTKKFLMAASALVLASFVTVSAAEARDGLYLSVKGGRTNPNMNSKKDSFYDKAAIDFDDVWFVSGAFGYRWKYFRAELEYTYRDDYSERVAGTLPGTMREASLEAQSYMVNGYIDLMPNYILSPYISGGLGYTDLTMTTRATGGNPRSWDENNFTWSLGGGLSIRLNKCLNFDFGYRYLDMGSIDEAEVNAHEYYAGLRYTF